MAAKTQVYLYSVMFRERSRTRATLRQEWIRYRQRPQYPDAGACRAGVAGAYLPPLLLDVPHEVQQRVSSSVPHCVSMVMRYHGAEPDVEWLAELLRTDEERGTPGARLEWLRAWGWRTRFPEQLQFFRDGTLELNHHLATGPMQLVFQWEERWLRYVTDALREGIPPILFVDLGRLYRGWRGFRQPHAVVLSGGEGRRAWINDPAREEGPVRVGLSTLMDALLPYEPLAALLTRDSAVPRPSFIAPGGGGRVRHAKGGPDGS